MVNKTFIQSAAGFLLNKKPLRSLSTRNQVRKSGDVLYTEMHQAGMYINFLYVRFIMYTSLDQ